MERVLFCAGGGGPEGERVLPTCCNLVQIHPQLLTATFQCQYLRYKSSSESLRPASDLLWLGAGFQLALAPSTLLRLPSAHKLHPQFSLSIARTV